MKLDPNKTWRLVEERLAGETNPVRRQNLELVAAHMRAESKADIDGVLATLTRSPRYVVHSSPDDPAMNPTGSQEAVREFYFNTIVRTGAHRLEYDVDRVIADDDGVFTEGVMRMAYPGSTLVAMGIDVDDPDGYYLAVSRMGIVWPVDHSEHRLTGEEVYSNGEAFAGIADRKISLSEIAEIVDAPALAS